MRLTVFLLLMILLSACTTTEKKSNLASFYLPANRAVVLPVTTQQAGLSSTSEGLTLALKQDLIKHKYQVIDIDPALYQQITESALNSTGAVYHPKLKQSLPLEPASYLRAVIEGLKHYYGFDVVFQSEIELRDAQVIKGIAHWDHAKIPLRLIEKPKNAPVPLKAKGVSLKLMAYTSLGGTIYRGYQGVTIPYQIVYQGSLGQIQMTSPETWAVDVNDIADKILKPYYPKVKIAHGN